MMQTNFNCFKRLALQFINYYCKTYLDRKLFAKEDKRELFIC